MDIFQYTWNAGCLIFGSIDNTKDTLTYKLDNRITKTDYVPFRRNENILSFHLKLIY